MKFIVLIVTWMSFVAFAGENLFTGATNLYGQGKYQATVTELNRIEKNIKKRDGKNRALIAYWKGMALNRLQEFKAASVEFNKAIGLGYVPADLHYELAQAYFAEEDFPMAKIHFNDSIKQGFKKGTCFYYLGYISYELGNYEDAKFYFLSIRRLSPVDAAGTRQAAEMKLADLELEEAEKEAQVFRVVRDRVIPQYETALEVDQASNLAPKIRQKIKDLQAKYELVLFQLRNGRPTLIPPYFLRASQEIGFDTNVTFTPEETTVSKAKQGSLFSKSEAMGRYTFYVKNYLSVAPELRLNYTRYFNRIPEIYRNDNYLLVPAIRTSYEHSLFGQPASVLLDYDFNYAQRDVDAKERLDFSSRAHVFMLGERFKFFSWGETVLRLRHRSFESFIPVSDSKTQSLVVEQTLGWGPHTILFYSSFDRSRVNQKLFDTNAWTIRGDWLMPAFRDWFNPSLGMGLTLTDPINDRSERGLEKNLNPSVRLSRSVGKGLRLNGRLEHQRNISKDKTSFGYKKNIVATELEYIF